MRCEIASVEGRCT